MFKNKLRTIVSYINWLGFISSVVLTISINLLILPTLAFADQKPTDEKSPPTANQELLNHSPQTADATKIISKDKTLEYGILIDFSQCMLKEVASKLLVPGTELIINQQHALLGSWDNLIRSFGGGQKQLLATNLVVHANDPEKIREAIENTTSALVFIDYPIELLTAMVPIGVAILIGHPEHIPAIGANAIASLPRNSLRFSEEIMSRGTYGSQALVPLTQFVILWGCPGLLNLAGLNEPWLNPGCKILSSAGTAVIFVSYINSDPKYEKLGMSGVGKNISLTKGWESFKEIDNTIPIFLHNSGTFVTTASCQLVGNAGAAPAAFVLNQIADSIAAAFIKAVKLNLPSKNDPDFDKKMQAAMDSTYVAETGLVSLLFAFPNPYSLIVAAKILDRENGEILSVMQMEENNKNMIELARNIGAGLKLTIPIVTISYILLRNNFGEAPIAPAAAINTILYAQGIATVVSAIPTTLMKIYNYPPTLSGIKDSVQSFVIALFITLPSDIYNYLNKKDIPKNDKVEL